jgi:hypothetical protein
MLLLLLLFLMLLLLLLFLYYSSHSLLPSHPSALCATVRPSPPTAPLPSSWCSMFTPWMN